MINTAVLLGRVGKIETTTLKNGAQRTTISLVTTNRFFTAEGKVDRTTWHNVNCYSKISDYVSKSIKANDLVYVQGEILNIKVKLHDHDCFMYSLHADKVKLIQKWDKSSSKESIETRTFDKSILCGSDHDIF